MPIYTKTGDKGETSLFGAKRVKKYDPQIEAYGSVDELTSFIGLVIAKIPTSSSGLRGAGKNQNYKDLLTYIQKDLYSAMGTLCGATSNLSGLEERVITFEKTIDAIDKKLPKLTRFILPQGGEVASLFHITRTVCRRAERNVVHFFDQSATLLPTKSGSAGRGIIVQYLNRLSDLLFMMARLYSRDKEVIT